MHDSINLPKSSGSVTVTSGSVSVTNFPSIQEIAGTVDVNNLPITQSIIGTVAVDNFPASQSVTGIFFQAVQPISGSAAITNFPASQPVTGSFFQAVQPISGSAAITNFPASQPVTGSFFQAVQPISGSAAITNFPASQPVTGSFFQAVQPISGSAAITNFPASQPVTGSFFQAIQPVSGSMAVTNFPASQPVTGSFFQAIQPVSGSVTALQGSPPWIAAPVDGQKATYSAAVMGLVVASTPTDVFVISGSSGKTIRVTRVSVSGTTTSGSGQLADIRLVKRSSANSGGSPTILPAVPHDSLSASATAVVQSYTANPVLGSQIGIVREARTAYENASSVAALIVWDFGIRPSQCIVLRGVGQSLAVNLNGVSVTGPNMGIDVEWTEE